METWTHTYRAVIATCNCYQPCLCLCLGFLLHTTRSRPFLLTNLQPGHLSLSVPFVLYPLASRALKEGSSWLKMGACFRVMALGMPVCTELDDVRWHRWTSGFNTIPLKRFSRLAIEYSGKKNLRHSSLIHLNQSPFLSQYLLANTILKLWTHSRGSPTWCSFISRVKGYPSHVDLVPRQTVFSLDPILYSNSYIFYRDPTLHAPVRSALLNYCPRDGPEQGASQEPHCWGGVSHLWSTRSKA